MVYKCSANVVFNSTQVVVSQSLAGLAHVCDHILHAASIVRIYLEPQLLFA